MYGQCDFTNGLFRSTCRLVVTVRTLIGKGLVKDALNGFSPPLAELTVDSIFVHRTV
jgi:hypothetical protein